MTNKVREYRKDTGKSVLELCVMAELSMPTFYKLERAKKREELESFNLGTLAKMCKVLKAKPADLFPGYF